MTKFQRPQLPKDITEEERRAVMFDALYSLDLSDKLEKRDNDKLSYLSWANAWAEFKRAYPNAEYKIIKNPTTSLPYFNDPEIGIMVYTEVTADNQTYEMWLPVMNGANKAMKEQAYSYQVYDTYRKQYVEKTVNAATMFDINKTIMRCLVKNLAMFGLGLYVYAGEDIQTRKYCKMTATFRRSNKQEGRKQRLSSSQHKRNMQELKRLCLIATTRLRL